MNTAAAIARFVLGLVFVVFGLNGFLNFMPMGPVPALAGQFFGALIESHYMAVVLTLEIVSGLLLLTNSYALLATAFGAGVFHRSECPPLAQPPAGSARVERRDVELVDRQHGAGLEQLREPAYGFLQRLNVVERGDR